jgi:hypothetical protein
MGESNYPDYKVHVSFIPEMEKDPDEGDKKGVSMKLTLDINGEFIDNPTTQVHPLYNQGTVKHYFKWINILNSIIRGQTITEKFHLALQTLRGTDAACGNANGTRQVFKLRKQPELTWSSKN